MRGLAASGTAIIAARPSQEVKDKIVTTTGIKGFGIAPRPPISYGMRDRLTARSLFLTMALAALPVTAFAQDTGAVDAATDVVVTAETALPLWQEDKTRLFDAAVIDPATLAYQARILVVFGEAEAQPQVRDQIALIVARAAELALRDVIVVVDTAPDDGSALRRQLRPRGFSLVLLDKDGTVVFRKPDIWDVREISRQIDKLPSRLQEVRG